VNPIAGNAAPQQEPKPMQDVVPSPKQTATQPPMGDNDAPIQPEIVSSLPVRMQEVPQEQAQMGASNSITSNRAPGPAPAGQDDKELDKVLEDVNQQIKKDDNKPPKIGIFKRWESAIVIIIALAVAAGLCLAAISAFKTK